MNRGAASGAADDRAGSRVIVPQSETTARLSFDAVLNAIEDTSLYAVTFEPDLAGGAHSLLALIGSIRKARS